VVTDRPGRRRIEPSWKQVGSSLYVPETSIVSTASAEVPAELVARNAKLSAPVKPGAGS
jgi:hypothetical protein